MRSESLPPAQWRVNRALPVVKLAGAALLAGLAVLLADGDPVRFAVAGLTALALVGWGVRDLLVPVRLAADPGGVTVVTGLAGRRHLAWSAIEKITLDTRARLGRRTELLEIDAVDSLHMFSRYDLGAAPVDVIEVLLRMWSPGHNGGHDPSTGQQDAGPYQGEADQGEQDHRRPGDLEGGPP